MLSPILFTSDSKRYYPLLIALTDIGIKSDYTDSARTLEALASKDYCAVILEWGVLTSTRLETVEQIQKRHPTLPIIALGDGSEIEAHFKEKNRKLLQHFPVTGDEKEDLKRLFEALRRVLPELGAQVLAVRDLLWEETSNPKMAEILTLVDILKDEPSSVLIQGENGTGKEGVARLLHYTGRRHAAHP